MAEVIEDGFLKKQPQVFLVVSHGDNLRFRIWGIYVFEVRNYFLCHDHNDKQ